MAELDPAFEEYRRRWGALLKLNEREAAQAFMRGEALSVAGDGQIERTPERVGLHLRVNGRGLDGAADPGALADMVSEWQAFLDVAPTSDPRGYAKQFIIAVVGANRHLDPELGPLAMCAAVWMLDDDALTALRNREGALLCDIEVNHSTRDIRTRLGLIEND